MMWLFQTIGQTNTGKRTEGSHHWNGVTITKMRRLSIKWLISHLVQSWHTCPGILISIHSLDWCDPNEAHDGWVGHWSISDLNYPEVKCLGLPTRRSLSDKRWNVFKRLQRLQVPSHSISGNTITRACPLLYTTIQHLNVLEIKHIDYNPHIEKTI